MGLVQKYIKKGDSPDKVVEILGSPNIVTKDSDGNETWIYDKVYQETSVSVSGSGSLRSHINSIFSGIDSIFSNIETTQKAETTQKTLTVIIRFDNNGLVKSITYNASQF